MRVHCEKCHVMYDDEFSWTICPHNPLTTGPRPEDFCKTHDLIGPCPLCLYVPPEERHPQTRAVVWDDFEPLGKFGAKSFHNTWGSLPGPASACGRCGAVVHSAAELVAHECPPPEGAALFEEPAEREPLTGDERRDVRARAWHHLGGDTGPAPLERIWHQVMHDYLMTRRPKAVLSLGVTYQCSLCTQWWLTLDVRRGHAHCPTCGLDWYYGRPHGC